MLHWWLVAWLLSWRVVKNRRLSVYWIDTTLAYLSSKSQRPKIHSAGSGFVDKKRNQDFRIQQTIVAPRMQAICATIFDQNSNKISPEPFYSVTVHYKTNWIFSCIFLAIFRQNNYRVVCGSCNPNSVVIRVLRT